MTYPDKTTRLILFLAGSFLFLYTALRAYLMSITYDEAYSYLEFARRDFWVPSEFNYMAGNNHLLNTWLMKIAVSLFGLSEFVIRLPNLMFHLVYLFFSYLVVRGSRSSIILVASFLLLNMNPFLLDFFSAGRGYGISMGLMMASLYFLLQYCKSGGWAHAAGSLVCIAMASIANISMLNFLVVLSGVILLIGLIHAASRKKWTVAGHMAVIVILCTGLLLWAYLPYVFRIRDAGTFFYGGERDFWNDTMHSLGAAMLYDRSYAMVLKLPLIILMAGGVAIGLPWLMIRQYRGFRGAETNFFLAILLITLGCALSTVVQHHLLQTKYLLDRTALFFAPLCILVLTLIVEQLWTARAGRYFLGGLAFLSILHFAFSFNLRYLLQWIPDSDTKDAVRILAEKRKTIPPERTTLTMGIDFVFEPGINFYRVKDSLYWLNYVRTEPADSLNDYFLFYKHTRSVPAAFRARMLFNFERTGNVLYENGLSPVCSEIAVLANDFEGVEGASIYKSSFGSGTSSCITDTLFRYSIGSEYVITDSLAGKHMLASFTAVVRPLEPVYDAAIVVSFERPDGAIYSWQSLHLKDFWPDPSGWSPVKLTRIFPGETAGGDRMKIYLWNLGDTPVLIDNLDTRILNCSF
ncbi:MAG: glycosyltransferase family 39 protein [Bacteroidota bacterium]